MSLDPMLIGGIIGFVSGAGLVAFAWGEHGKDPDRAERRNQYNGRDGNGYQPLPDRRRRVRHPSAPHLTLDLVQQARRELEAEHGPDAVRFDAVLERARQIAGFTSEGLRA